jgi:hypothetical protein
MNFFPLTCLILGLQGILNGQVHPSTGQRGFPELCDSYAGFDQDGDGKAEIEALRHLWTLPGDGKRLVVLVEARLLQPVSGGAENLSADDVAKLRPKLHRLLDDLANEGWTPSLVSANLPKYEVHQDGLHLLALREFLRAARECPAEDGSVPGLGGVILVGRFPDAYLVRTCNWRKKEDLILRKGQKSEAKFSKVPYLRRVPECVAKRADIVLADLDGAWEDVYVQPRVRLQSTVAVFPNGVPERGGICADLEFGGYEYEDFFHVADGRLEVAPLLVNGNSGSKWHVTLFDEHGDLECSVEDLNKPNRIARPDILVSRIDAQGASWSPSAEIVGKDGKHLMDENGQAQVVKFESKEKVPSWNSDIWQADPILERQLLAEYFDRNHAFRTGTGPLAFTPSSIAHALGSGYRIIKSAAPEWVELKDASADIRGKPDLVSFVNWMKRPALLRTIRAHSDSWGSVFNKTSTADLNAAVCSDQLAKPLSWTRKGNELHPSLESATSRGKLDFFLLRSLWASGQVPAEPSIYLHTGCDITAPPGAHNLSFHDPNYARRAGGSSLMFFTGGLALVGRAKVFYDEPKGFSQSLAAGQTIGEAWAKYYELESQASTWKQAGGDIGRKRSYFWSVLGDCTLTLKPRLRENH